MYMDNGTYYEHRWLVDLHLQEDCVIAYIYGCFIIGCHGEKMYIALIVIVRHLRPFDKRRHYM